jgi:hypothetical protein
MSAGSAVPSSEAATAIRSAFRSYLEDPAALGLTTDLAVLAEALDALPVYADIGGAILIRPSGEVLLVHSNQAWDATASHEVQSDPYWRRVAFDSCVERFPLLRAVVDELRADI